MEDRQALKGVKVLDMTIGAAGPMTAALLAQWGADVIKVEQPGLGDQTRTVQFPVLNYLFEHTNMNKRSLTADLRKKEAREIVYKLAKKSDVFLSNFRPYEVKKFEMSYETLKAINPMIIYANLTGFGINGPEKDAPGIDFSAYFARSGITYMLSKPGEVPVRTRLIEGDYPVAMELACGIMVALFAREKQGIGQAVYTSLFNCGVWNLSMDIMRASVTHEDLSPADDKSVFYNPLANFYKTKDDRWIFLSRNVRTVEEPDPYWKTICQALEMEKIENDPRFNTEQHRLENSTALSDAISGAFAEKDLEVWKARLAEFAIRFVPVYKPIEILNDPQARANDFFQAIDHPVYGKLEFPGNPLKFTETPGTLRTPAPALGQHTEEILRDLGYTPDKINLLRKEEVI